MNKELKIGLVSGVLAMVFFGGCVQSNQEMIISTPVVSTIVEKKTFSMGDDISKCPNYDVIYMTESVENPEYVSQKQTREKDNEVVEESSTFGIQPLTTKMTVKACKNDDESYTFEYISERQFLERIETYSVPSEQN